MELQWIFMILILAYTLYASLLFVMTSKNAPIFQFVSLIVFVLTLYVMFQRDTYLPFLGKSVLPMSVLKDQLVPEGADKEVTVAVAAKDGTKVIYWGALPADKTMETPWVAYGNYANTGIAVVKDGHVTFRFQCPAKYRVPSGRALDRHVHYRTCCDKNVMLSPIQTVYVKC